MSTFNLKGNSSRTKPVLCLACGKMLDAATRPHDKAEPKPGSISICIGCGNVMAFDTDMSLRALNAEEQAWAARSPEVARFRGAVEMIKAKIDQTKKERPS